MCCRPFVLSKVSALRSHGVTRKQSLFDVIFCIFISWQVIDFKYTKKLFLERAVGMCCRPFVLSKVEA